MAGRKLKVGIIGANWTGQYHIPVWRLIPDVEVVAICTASKATAEAAAAKYGVERAYWDYRKLCEAPDLDIITCGTSPQTRYDMVLTALENNKHVYNCIPFATDAAKGKHMLDLLRAKDRVGAIDAQWRWAPAIQRMKEMIAEGKLGRLFHVTVHLQLSFVEHDGFRYPHLVMSPTSDRPYWWNLKAAAGSSAWRHSGSHSLLLLMYLFGEIEEIVGGTQRYMDEYIFPNGERVRPEVADHSMALLRFKNGGTANIVTSWATPDGPGFFMQAEGSKGRFVARDTDYCFCDAGTTTLFYGDTRQRNHMGETGSMVDLPERLFNYPGSPYTKQNTPMYLIGLTWLFDDFARVIRAGAGQPSPSFEEAYHVQLCIEAMERSQKTRSWVRIADMEATL